MFGHPHMFGCLHMFGNPPHVWMPPVCFDDVWMPPVHTQDIESMLCQTKGVAICSNTFGCPHMFGWPPYV